MSGENNVELYRRKHEFVTAAGYVKLGDRNAAVDHSNSN